MTGHANGTRADDRDVHTVDYEEPPSTAVVAAVAAAAGIDAHDVEQPLYEVVDPDALDDVFRSAAASADPEVSFTFADHHVTVTAETIAVGPLDA